MKKTTTMNARYKYHNIVHTIRQEPKRFKTFVILFFNLVGGDPCAFVVPIFQCWGMEQGRWKLMRYTSSIHIHPHTHTHHLHLLWACLFVMMKMMENVEWLHAMNIKCQTSHTDIVKNSIKFVWQDKSHTFLFALQGWNFNVKFNLCLNVRLVPRWMHSLISNIFSYVWNKRSVGENIWIVAKMDVVLQHLKVFSAINVWNLERSVLRTFYLYFFLCFSFSSADHSIDL